MLVFQLKPPEWKCGFSPDGRRVGTIHPSGIVQVWELPSGKPIWSLRSTNEIEAGIVWLPDWSGVVLARSNTVEIVPVASSGQRLQLEGHTHRIRRLAVSPDGKRVAALAADDTLRIWDSTSGQPLAVFPVIAGGQRLFFTGDGRLVVAAAGTSRRLRCRYWRGVGADGRWGGKHSRRPAGPGSGAVRDRECGRPLYRLPLPALDHQRPRPGSG